MKSPILFFSVIFLLTTCNSSEVSKNESKNLAVKIVDEDNQFKEYWYQGKAEITSYDLEQARYGELHKGHAVLVFVTEEFRLKKIERLEKIGSDHFPIYVELVL